MTGLKISQPLSNEFCVGFSQNVPGNSPAELPPPRRSAPTQNALPSPVTIATHASSSSRNRANASFRSFRSSRLIAFECLGPVVRDGRDVSVELVPHGVSHAAFSTSSSWLLRPMELTHGDDILVPLPPQPADVPWPAADPDGWPVASTSPRARQARRRAGRRTRIATARPTPCSSFREGRLLVERYGGALPHFDRPPEPVTPTTPLLSWSMAKSVLHAGIGLLVADGQLELDAPAPVPAWHEHEDDPRAAITLEHLLTMRDGLDFTEDYVDAGVSDVIEMLFGSGQGRCRGVCRSASARVRARHAVQLLVGNVEHRRRDRGTLRGQRCRVRRPAPAGGCSSRSA